MQAARASGIEVSRQAVEIAYRIVDFHHRYSSVSIHTSAARQAFYEDYNRSLCQVLGLATMHDRLQLALVSGFSRDKRWKLRDDVPHVLEDLQARDVPMVIVANWDRTLPRLVEDLGVSRYFRGIVSSQAAGVEKPDPSIFRHAFAYLNPGTAVSEVVYLGNDYGLDVVGARRAGLTPVLIDAAGLYPHADCLRYASLKQWLEAVEATI